MSGDDRERERAQRSVESQFPEVARFLAGERAEERAPQDDGMVTVPTDDHGDVTLPEPFWCLGDHPAEAYREDIVHEGVDQPLTVSTPCHGVVQLATAYLVQRPFAPSDPGVRVAVEFDEIHEFDAASLAGLADALVAYAVGPLHQLIERLQLLEGGES